LRGVIGKTFSHYRILAKLGAGGMGEVYRARDEQLGREVAVKVLPQTFAREPERMARLRREAQVLASLNHPNVAAIYGLEETPDGLFLILELVPGQTLAERLKGTLPAADGPASTLDHRRVPLPVNEVLEISKQVAEGVEAAHEKGVIHRDLKPGNIKLTTDEKVKILDFGLAKAMAEDSSVSSISDSPTLTTPATRAGMLLGTAAYMSPEQARAKSVDRRADIWAFGCVVYEMLAGKQAFEGETVSDALAAVLRGEPDWSALPRDTPRRIRQLLARCFEKDPRRRLRDIGDARLEIEEAIAKPEVAEEAVAPVAAPKARPLARLPWAIAGLLLGVAATAAVWYAVKPRVQLAPTVSLSFSLPAGQPFDQTAYNIAISPDGTEAAFVAGNPRVAQIYLRRLNEFAAKPVAGTQGGKQPFFSPDGQSLGFSANGKLEKVAISGGPPQVLCDVESFGGAAWSPDGMIYFSSLPASQGESGALLQVPASGGIPRQIYKTELGAVQHALPALLPGGKKLLFTVFKGFSAEEASIAVLSLDTGKWETLIENGTDPHYVQPGYLVFARQGTLWAAPFDPSQAKISGAPTPVLAGVMASTSFGTDQFDTSQNGVLVYIPGASAEPERVVTALDRSGKARTLTAEKRPYEDLSLSLDGHYLAMTLEGPQWSIWTYDLTRRVLTRLTLEGDNRDPFWTPDGQHVVYTSLRNKKWGLYERAADGTGQERELYSSNNWVMAVSFSPDGKLLAFIEVNPSTRADIFILPMEGDHKPQPFVQTPATDWFPEFSPDGRWIAYESDESGRSEVYVQPYPGLGGRLQISSEGGSRPVWNHNGRELYYINEKKVMAVPILGSPAFTAGTPRVLFEADFYTSGHYYDISPDSLQFYFIKDVSPSSPPTEANVILNWATQIQQTLSSTAH
jgi:eukaryotic-like serine/threonine-protein kinase